MEGTQSMEALVKNHYTGSNAKNYDSGRNRNPKWKSEQRAVEEFIRNNEDVTSVIDAPLGTNRFNSVIQTTDRITKFYGYELSDDMISEAKKHISSKLEIFKWDLVNKPIDKQADLTLSIRMLNLLPEKQSLAILENVLNASSKYSIFTLRCWDKEPTVLSGKIHVQRQAPFFDMVEECGFKITNVEDVSTEAAGDYKIITCERL